MKENPFPHGHAVCGEPSQPNISAYLYRCLTRWFAMAECQNQSRPSHLRQQAGSKSPAQ
jgi:hypothetical protein